jgi:hypothetical protein
MGPVIGSLWHEEREGEHEIPPAELGEAELNTIGYVLSRYGALSGVDLRHLTHSEQPWRDADNRRIHGTSARIPIEAIRDYFTSAQSDDEPDGGLTPLDADAVAAWLKDAPARRSEPARRDSVEGLRSRLASRSR